MAKLNSMCDSCTSTECPGTVCPVWTGCVYRETDTNEAAGDLITELARRHDMNKAAMYADLKNQITDLADIAESKHDFARLEAMLRAAALMQDNIAAEWMQRQGYRLDESGHLPKWTKGGD